MGECLENLGLSQLSKVWCYVQFPHCLPTSALFHDSVNALDHAIQNLSGFFFSALCKGVGHSRQNLGSTKKQHPAEYQSVGRLDVSTQKVP